MIATSDFAWSSPQVNAASSEKFLDIFMATYLLSSACLPFTMFQLLSLEPLSITMNLKS